MIKNLRLSYIQADLIWEDRPTNLKKLEKLIDELPETDLIVLPEMFPTGFSMNPSEICDTADGEVIQWMHKQAKLTQAAIAGSLVVLDEGKFYNRFYLAQPNGEGVHYDKRHLFRMGNEHLHYVPGNERVVVDVLGWKIRPMICYDLRFPVWSRNSDNYDILLYVANWPAKRREHWVALLKARAIENQAFVVGVNRSGVDGNGFTYSGDSAVYAPDGTILSADTYNKLDYVQHIVLSHKSITNLRHTFPAWQDADAFDLL